MTLSTEERVARLEGIIEDIRRELSQIHAQMNTLTALLVGTWITTIVTILGVGAALFFKV